SSSPLYTGPITVNATVTLKAKAWQQGSESTTVTATYVVVPPTEGGDRPVVFTNASGVAVNGNSLTKTAATVAWASGAAGKDVIRDGYGYVEFTATETNTHKALGLSNGDSSRDLGDIDYALYLNDAGAVHVYEAGTYRGTFASYVPGDRMRIEVQYGVVRYRKNGVVLYTSTVSTRYPLRVDTSLYTPGATIADVRFGNVAWANEVNVSVAGSSLAKAGAAGWTSGAVSANAIEAADGFMEFTATETNTTRIAGFGNADVDQ